MSVLQRILGIVFALLLAIALLAWWRTAPLDAALAATASSTGSAATARASDSPELVDQSAYNTSLHLLALPDNVQEFALAQSAARLADHDLDLAFTAALRRVDAEPPPISELASQIAARLNQSQQRYARDKQRVTALTAALAAASAERRATLQDELDLTQSQLELDQYEIDEASQDLEDAGGNLRRRIATQMQDRENQEKSRPAATSPARPADVGHQGLVHDFRTWQSERALASELIAAQREATTLAMSLLTDRQTLAQRLEANKSAVAGLASHSKQARDAAVTAALPAAHGAVPQPASHADSENLVTQTKRVAAAQQVLTLLDQRIHAQRSLSAVYAEWNSVVSARARATLHDLLLGVIIIIALLFVLLFVDRWLQQLLSRSKQDRRRVQTLHSVGRVTLQVIALLVVLLILIGLPDRFGTVLGLLGAGLTVALKDFIVAFIGWVVLMGKNGMRLGDWVEINGVSGEVSELGVFHTVLQETGNWGDAGNPTGRRVTFTNSFAIEGHYFNFSTSGQWLWDELQLVVPASVDPHPIIDAIRQRVIAATADSAHQAEQEWQRTVPAQSGRLFSGAPGLNVKPVVGGVEISVRYITRAHERYALRASLYQAAVDLLGGRMPTATLVAASPGGGQRD